MTNTGKHPVVCFGEVLWDILPAGSMPGGAPVNVAYHLEKLGKSPALVTRVGNDDKGQELQKVFSSAGVNTHFFQLDDLYATGKVYGKPNEHGDMVYDIVSPAAWDNIAWSGAVDDLVCQSTYFVFGSLACRNTTSKQTLSRLLEAASRRVLDINLRAPYFSQALVTELLQNCDILKLNIDELELIAGWFGRYTGTVERLEAIQEKFAIDTIIVTMGADGAMLCLDGIIHQQPGYKVTVADTVGAGDAFLAGFLTGLLDDKNYIDILQSASVMGAFIASRAGACPAYTMAGLENFTNLITKQHSAIQTI